MDRIVVIKVFVIATVVFSVQFAFGHDVNISVGINAPLPHVVVPASPSLVVVPGTTYVYMIHDLDAEIYFYRGHWYRPHAGVWYRANVYNGPWVVIDRHRLPHAIVGLPHGPQRIHPYHPPVPYSKVRANWKAWERDRYWHAKEHNKAEREAYKAHRKAEREAQKAHREQHRHDHR